MEAFVSESKEHLDTVEDEILGLERGEPDSERVHRLYRSLHTVKGAASFLGLQRPTQLAHALEDVVGQLRAGTMAPNESTTEALLRGVDKLKQLVEFPEDESATIDAEVEALRRLRAQPEPATKAEPSAGSSKTSVARARPESAAAPAERSREAPPPPLQGPRDARSPIGDGAAGGASRAEPARATDAPRSPSATASGAAGEGHRAGSRAATATNAGPATVRISLALLDKLMNLGSELVLVRNQALQALDASNWEQLLPIGQQLNVVTSELQATIMQTRMRPVGDVFSQFRRVVRDLARKMDKQVDLAIFGAEVELDKNIIEAIKDPLTHLIRNAVDHGVEAASERISQGKPARGAISLSAFHQGGQVHIRVTDDGRGMNPIALKEEAVRRGAVTRDVAEAMTNREAFALIFNPGFSMAERVTDLSGRGVGMDVVKSSFNRLGGVVEVSSELGVGTSITVRLPLTLAIVPALIVAVENVYFAVPQLNVEEVVWLYGDQVFQSLKIVDDQEVYWLRGKLLPILRLAKLLGIEKTFVDSDSDERVPDQRSQRPDRRSRLHAVEDDSRAGPRERRTSPQNSVYMLVLKLGEQQFGLLVDRVVDTEEIVVKALHDQLKDCRAFAGTTVLGDGRIAMILDVAALVELTGLSFGQVEMKVARSSSSSDLPKTALLFDVGGREWFAAPLSVVTRVEEIRRDDIQVAQEREYLRYRETTIPLVRLENAMPNLRSSYDDEPLYVILPKCRRPFGVLAAHILDTVDIDTDVDTDTIAQPGVFGSAVIAGRLTLFVDFFEALDRVEPGWLRSGPSPDDRQRQVLLLEDSGFLAAQIRNYLRSAGVVVRHAVNGEEALTMLEEGLPDVIVSDIEMPGMDGLEFARRVRAEPRTRDIPLYAISAMPEDIAASRAFEAGFDAFESKSSHDRLFDRLTAWCQARGTK